MGIREGSVYKFRLRRGGVVLGYVIDKEKRLVATNTGKLKTLREEEFESGKWLNVAGSMHVTIYMKSKMSILKDVGKFSKQRVLKEWGRALDEDKIIGNGEVLKLLDIGMQKYGYNCDIMPNMVESKVITSLHFDKGIDFNEELHRVAAKARLLGRPIKSYGQYEEFDRLVVERMREVGYFRYFGKNKRERMKEEMIIWEGNCRHQFELSTALKCTRKGVQEFLDDLEEMLVYEKV